MDVLYEEQVFENKCDDILHTLIIHFSFRINQPTTRRETKDNILSESFKCNEFLLLDLFKFHKETIQTLSFNR